MKEENPRFVVSVDALADDFPAAPTEFQRTWVLGRALREFVDDLCHIDELARRFVTGHERPGLDEGWEESSADLDTDELVIQDQQVMQAWEYPLMKRLAQVVGEAHGDVLELGFGMGISATYLQKVGVRSHTIIECNQDVIESFEEWRQRFPDQEIHLVPMRWEEAVGKLESFDGILFDTYPLSQREYEKNEVRGVAYTHAAQFFPDAARLLRPGGVFSYFSCEIDTLSRGHQRELLEHFDSFGVDVVRGLRPPDGCQYWWSDSMVVVKARKGA